MAGRGEEERPVAGGGEERPVAGGEEEELEAVEPAQARRGAGGGGLRGCCAGRRPRPRRGQLARMPWLPGRLALHASARPRRLCTAGHGDAQAREAAGLGREQGIAPLMREPTAASGTTNG